MSIEEIIIQRGITEVVHFTTHPGLTGVYAAQGAQVRNLGGTRMAPEVAEVLTAFDEVAGGDPA